MNRSNPGLPTISAALLLALGSSAAAQSELLASYPLLNDANDATGTYGPMVLQGNQTSPPAPANGLCTNGIYSSSPGGHYVGTPAIVGLDPDDFEFALEFRLTSLPPNPGPILMGSLSWRWIGIYIDSSGAIGIRANNFPAQFSSTILTTGTWYSATLKHESGTIELYVDGAFVQQWSVAPLVTGNSFEFTTNDGGTAENFDGCIRNLQFANNTTLGSVATAERFGVGCDGLELTSSGVPSLGSPGFELILDGVTGPLPVAFLTFGGGAVLAGIDLGLIGMAGCSTYTTADFGFYGAYTATAATATIPLAIPNDPSLAGTVLMTQAIAPTNATALGLAASNGMRLRLAP